MLIRLLPLLLSLAWGLPAIAGPLDAPLSGLTTPVDLKALKGKVVLLDIWATWCDPCRASLPNYEALKKRFGARGFEVLAISVDEDRAAAQAFFKKAGFSFLAGWDPTGAWPDRLKLKVMPTAWLIDRSGAIHTTHEGFHPGDEAKLAKQIETLLATP